MDTRNTRMAAARVALGLVGLAVAGCGDVDPGAAERDAKLDRLVAAVEDLNAAQRDLAEAVRRQNRHIATLGRGLAIDGTAGAVDGPSGSTEAGSGAESGGAAGDTGQPADGADIATTAAAVERVLASDAGQRAIARAAEAEAERRETEERRTFVSFTIARFARDAGLDERQTDALQAIWKDSLDAGATLRRDFAALRDVPEADRPAAREALMETMRSIGRSRNERIGALLTQTQQERYQPVEQEIMEAMHGAPRRPPARAGGGRGQ